MRMPILVRLTACLALLGLAGFAGAKPWWMRGVESNETDFLPPDVAFRVSARADGNVVRVRWVIADGYYLYRQRIDIKAESPDLVIAAPLLPKGTLKTDPYLGTQEIYHQQVEAAVAYTRYRRRRPSPADQSDLSGLRRSRPVLPPHHQGALPRACRRPCGTAPASLGRRGHSRRRRRLSPGRIAATQGTQTRPSRGMNATGAAHRRRRPAGGARHLGGSMGPFDPGYRQPPSRGCGAGRTSQPPQSR